MATVHTRAFNLARRATEKYENDLLRKWKCDRRHLLTDVLSASIWLTIFLLWFPSIDYGNLEENFMDGKFQWLVLNVASVEIDSDAFPFSLLTSWCSCNLPSLLSAGASSYATERYCSSLLNQHLPRDFELPQECKNYASVRAALQKSAADVDPAVAFAGMSPGEAQAAQSAREHRRPNSAQIKRRLTSRSKDSSSSWF